MSASKTELESDKAALTTPSVVADDENGSAISDEWGGLEPTDKQMGMVQFTLDKGVRTTVVGTVYGLDFEIEGDGYSLRVFFDYYNRRLKVLDYEAEDYSGMIKRMAHLAEANSFDKVFIKARLKDFQIFLSHGYMMEGVLRYYFHGEDAYVLSRFSSLERASSDALVKEAELIENLIYGERPKRELPPLDSDVVITRAKLEHIPALVQIYRSVFETYPSPLTNPDYIKATMDRKSIYCLALKNGAAAAAASADISGKHGNAEMTDCATDPAMQGKGLMKHILLNLEDDLRQQGVQTAYTLARAMSVGMNSVFYRLGYEFSGRLINNCDIFGQFEDMNIWVKRLAFPAR
ncbi:MAG: putative beta-lysine N-acetyltransferase [Candidatus Lernaella stagnicola]|nr:putative beta-lysine N-acetyltransferase [Candidatus Lernaella stagnicola]